MDQKEILNFCFEKGILLDKDVLNLFSDATDTDSVRMMIEKIRENTHSKIITKNIFVQGIKEFGQGIPDGSQENLEKLRIKLGLELEISREIPKVASPAARASELYEIKSPEETFGIKIRNFPTSSAKKPDVEDFTSYFRGRFNKIRPLIQSHPNLKNLVSINKISGNRQGMSVIGLVSDRRITKNNNILFEVEDPTGKIKVLVNGNKPALYSIAEEITLDSIIGVVGSGNNEIIFANEIIFPDSMLTEKKKSPLEEYALFIGDIHFGSKLFLREGFEKFINYLNGKIPNTPEVSKIKYLFVVGDLVSGIGIYPEQEKDLKINNIEEQYRGISDFLKQIRKDIAIIVIAGNHDAVRLMEPQPMIDKKYAPDLYGEENIFMATNPCWVNMGAKPGFSGVDVLVYHGFSYPYYADNIPSLIQANAINSPDKIMAYLLKNRHLAPTHSSTQYYPFEDDPLVIDKIPDIFVSGHTHKCAVSFYNNTLVISGAAWESKTEFQEKMGNEPDFCKVPIYNLKTGGVKILDFE